MRRGRPSEMRRSTGRAFARPFRSARKSGGHIRMRDRVPVRGRGEQGLGNRWFPKRPRDWSRPPAGARHRPQARADVRRRFGGERHDRELPPIAGSNYATTIPPRRTCFSSASPPPKIEGYSRIRVAQGGVGDDERGHAAMSRAAARWPERSLVSKVNVDSTHDSSTDSVLRAH